MNGLRCTISYKVNESAALSINANSLSYMGHIGSSGTGGNMAGHRDRRSVKAMLRDIW
ncbi:hypothetical protein [Sinorhizobium sp. BG8]|uniref:hypothetical protein n=1 Tax=Sinorhizobium sp. BG8 TaxID=2613773 RepID=UPI00193D9268|nr:hypothetical protein [Sinorhizobium sp. BG8]